MMALRRATGDAQQGGSFLPASFLLCDGLALCYGLYLLGLARMHAHSTMYVLGALLVSGSLLLFAARLVYRHGADHFSVAVFTLAGIVSLHYLHISHDVAYTNDWQGHFSYIYYISNHWLDPYGYGGCNRPGCEQHHPPFYYYAAALFLSAARKFHLVQPVVAVRFFSWLSYLVFNAFNLFTLRRVGFPRPVYRVCTAMLLLWPAGFHLASKISNEAFYYAWYAAAFYFTVCWYQQGRRWQLITAIALAGAALMARSNAVILFALLAVLMAVAWKRGRLQISPLQQWAELAAWLVCCVLINTRRLLNGLLTAHVSLQQWTGQGVKESPFMASHFFTVHYGYIMDHPFCEWQRMDSFWDYLLKTSLFGEYKWGWPTVALVMETLLIVSAVYSLFPWLIMARRMRRGMVPFVAGFVVPVLFLIGFTLLHPDEMSQDARYVYPLLPCFVVLFGQSLARLRERGETELVMIGKAQAWVFVAVGIIFFWMQAR